MSAEVENAHPTGKIGILSQSRPFKRRLLQIAKIPDKKAMLNGVGFTHDERKQESTSYYAESLSRKERKSSLEKKNFI